LRLENQASEARRRVEEARQALESWIDYDNWLQADEACGFIGESLKELLSLRIEIKDRYRKLPWWRKFMWPDVTTLAQQEALTFLRRIERKVEVMHRATREGESVNCGQLNALLGAVGFMREQVGEFLEKIYTAQRERDEQARNILEEALSGIRQERQEAEAELCKKLEELGKRIRDAIQPTLTQLNERVERVRQEGAKLGLNP
jgi:DNA repair exonuclease SbcCD ATPase subunit